jgi:DNA-binding winged helix-turn-helix (wHTH) protein
MSQHDDVPLGFGPYRIDLQTRTLFKDEEPVHLTPYQFDCLRLLVQLRGHLVTFDKFLTEVWKESPRGRDKRTLNAKIMGPVLILQKMLGDQPNGNPWIRNRRGHGYLLDADDGEDNLSASNQIASQPGASNANGSIPQKADLPHETRKLPRALEGHIDALLLGRPVADTVREVLTAESYPMMMALSADRVKNPIWRMISADDRQRLAREFSPFGPFPPRIMDLDIFLLRADDAKGNPYLLNYFSGKPKSGWQAYMLLFRHKSAGESEEVRQMENAKDIANFFLMDPSDFSTKSLGDQFVVSVKPDPGYSELVLYIFKFCVVTMRAAPEWLACETPELTIMGTVRRFKWIHPEELEEQERAVLVDGDVLRGVHEFFTTLIPTVPIGFPAVIPQPSKS